MFKFISKFISISLIGAIAINTTSLMATSLWKKAGKHKRSFFVDKIAFQAGDILTVIVSESTALSNDVSTDTTKDASITNAVTSFLFPAAASGFGSHNGSLPSTNITGNNEFDGSGTISNTQTVTGRITVLVTDVLPNGNLVVEGVRKVTFADETLYAVLRGFVRKYDIAADNMVNSDRIADARIEFLAEGALTEAQKKGWLLQFNDAINPF